MEPPSAPEEHDRAQFYAAAVHGSIVAAAMLAALRQKHESSQGVLFALLATLFVFWDAHVWSTLVGERIQAGRTFKWRRAARIGRSEWPLVEAAFLPAIPLVLGWVGVLGSRTAVNLALALCFLQLLGWGLAVGRAAYDRWWQALLTGVLDAGLGIVVVGLDLLLVH